MHSFLRTDIFQVHIYRKMKRKFYREENENYIANLRNIGKLIKVKEIIICLNILQEKHIFYIKTCEAIFSLNMVFNAGSWWTWNNSRNFSKIRLKNWKNTTDEILASVNWKKIMREMAEITSIMNQCKLGWKFTNKTWFNEGHVYF